ncbi:unnamed protein product [Arctia plantaginis]|uniref:Uncharacterized protein n=1 Tax=Arctia plantaginis TaxID=874455 RepID=A0A8S1BLK0_ARCPL|nr:unnamed protein product [Arctia plantaginis]
MLEFISAIFLGFCKLDPEPSVLYMRHVPGIGLIVCCNYVAKATLVSPICNTPSYYSSESLPKMKCAIGFLNYVAKCKAASHFSGVTCINCYRHQTIKSP